MLHFKYDYFLHPKNDGNQSLSTTEARIADTCKLLDQHEVICFEDGTQVSSKKELIDALSMHSAELIESANETATNTSSKIRVKRSSNHNQNQRRKDLIISIVILAIFCISVVFIGVRENNQTSQHQKSQNYIEEARALGFPTGEINHWINNTMEQNNCKFVRVTSVKADGQWCLNLYMDVEWYKNFRSEGEPHKAVLSLWYEPTDGRIWSVTIEFLDK